MRRPPASSPVAPRDPATRAVRRARVAHRALWAVQALLAALFLFAGGTKLVLPLAALTAQTPLPGAFLRAVGVLEVLGALGLVLPGLLPRIFHRAGALTGLAAAGLVLLMCGAVGATLASPTTGATPALALMPVVVGALTALVAYGRSRPWLAPTGVPVAGVATPPASPTSATADVARSTPRRAAHHFAGRSRAS